VRRRLVLLAAGALLCAMAATAAGATERGASRNAAYLSKAQVVAQGYWNFRRPGSSCADRPVEIQIVPPRLTYDQPGYALIGICQQPPGLFGDTWIKVSTSYRNRGWLPFCTVVLQ
jgi:hypothetical protein